MSRNAEMIRELRAKAKAEGKCGTCRLRPQKTDRKTCQDCIDRAGKTKKRLVAEGRCPCGADCEPGRTRCRRCRDADNRRQRRAEERALTSGLCRHCKREPVKQRGMTHCQACIDRASRYSQKWRAGNRAKGLCGCGAQPTRGYKSCEDCRAYWNARAELLDERSAA